MPWTNPSVFSDKLTFVMAGLVPAIHAFLAERKTWMPGTRPGMTEKRIQRNRKRPKSAIPRRLGRMRDIELTTRVEGFFRG
jgi:hypothetical protein